MSTTLRRSFAALAVAVIVSLVSLFGAEPARAQCATITFTNNTDCTINLTFENAAGQLMTFTNITPGVSVHNYPIPGFVSVGIRTAKGNFVGNPGPPGCFDNPCITAFITGTTDKCCVVPCYGAGCTMTINPANVEQCPRDCQ